MASGEGYAVNDEGVSALNSTAATVAENIEQLQSLTQSLKTASDEYNDTLGPHKASLDYCLESIEASIKTASGPAAEVSEKLAIIAEIYEDIIANDPFSSISGN